MKKKKRSRLPHDTMGKDALTYPDVARDFIKYYLPPELRELCDLETLHVESGEYAVMGLRRLYGDVTLSVKTLGGKSQIKILIEFQSSPGRFIASRMMQYVMAAVHRIRRSGDETPTWVVPVLHYNGRRSPYPGSTNWLRDLGPDFPEFMQRIYGGGSHFPLVDVTVLPDAEILTHGKMAALTFLQKHVRLEDLARHADTFIAILRNNPLPQELENSLINYTMTAGETRDAKAFWHQLKQHRPHLEENMMTWAEELRREGEQRGLKKGIAKGIEKGIEQGIEKGIEKGIEQGRATGRNEGKIEVALTMLRNGLDHATVLQWTGLAQEDLAHLALPARKRRPSL